MFIAVLSIMAVHCSLETKETLLIHLGKFFVDRLPH